VVALLAAGITAATLTVGPAPARAVAPATGRTLAMQKLGLTVVIHDGFLSAQGPAADIRAAAALFAGVGDLAVYRGHNETGTGTIAIAVDRPGGDDFVELQTADATIASVQNNYPDPFGIYTGTGTRVAVVPLMTEQNIAASRADSGAEGEAVGSPGVVSGNVIQVPLQIPISLCGSSIDIVGLLNPTFGNTCVNS
jgi:hypothetical protein